MQGGINFFPVGAITLPDHLAHACCADDLSPMEQAAGLVADGACGAKKVIAAPSSGAEGKSIAKRLTIIKKIDPKQTTKSSGQESFYACWRGRWQVIRKTVDRADGLGVVDKCASRLPLDDGLDSGPRAMGHRSLLADPLGATERSAQSDGQEASQLPPLCTGCSGQGRPGRCRTRQSQ